MPDAGTRGRPARPVGSGCGVTPVTMPSAMPYSSGSAPATTPPVRLMCSTPGHDRLGVAPRSAATISAHSSRLRGDPGELAADDEQVERQPGDQQDDVDDRQHDHRGHILTLPSTRPRNRWCSRPSARTASTPLGGLADQRGVRGVRAAAACSVSRTMHDPPVDRADQQHQDGQQRGDGEDDDEAADDRAPPQVALGRRSARARRVQCTPSSASQPGAAAVQAGHDDLGVVDGRVQLAERRGVVHRLGQRVVDRRAPPCRSSGPAAGSARPGRPPPARRRSPIDVADGPAGGRAARGERLRALIRSPRRSRGPA